MVLTFDPRPERDAGSMTAGGASELSLTDHSLNSDCGTNS